MICPILSMCNTVATNQESPQCICMKEKCAWWVKSEALYDDVSGVTVAEATEPMCGILKLAKK